MEVVTWIVLEIMTILLPIPAVVKSSNGSQHHEIVSASRSGFHLGGKKGHPNLQNIMHVQLPAC